MNRKKIKESLNKEVLYNGAEYIFTACIFRLKPDNSFYCQAELQDKRSGSVVICRLDDVEEKYD